MKFTYFSAVVFSLFSVFIYAQNTSSYSLGFESNSQYYMDDSVTGVFDKEYRFRSNNFLKTSYTYNKFTFGVQAESYLPKHLLNFSPHLDQKINVATYFASYTADNWDMTLGYFYGQFGNGLIFRSWEDRQLGINNALRGVKVSFRPTARIAFTALHGRQRVGFGLSEGKITGMDSNFDLSSENTGFQIGLSFINRHQDIAHTNPEFSPDTQAYSYRAQFVKNNFYTNVEGAFKTKDALVESNVVYENNLFYGNALLLEMGYSKKGFGLTTSLRRLENMSFYTDREASGNLYNEQIVNYIPGLTKQHDYLLANIYVYQAQPVLSPNAKQAGEIGGQVDLYYKFKRKSLLGGKYGTKLAFNISSWYGLDAQYNDEFKRVHVNFGPDELYYRDISMEIRKKFSKKISGIAMFSNSYYNKGVIEGEALDVNASLLVAEATYKFTKKRSMRVEAQHLWTKVDMKNWAAGTFEYNLNTHLSFFANDMYNYGNEEAPDHYFNLGGSYTVNRSRFAMSYGRTRGGLLCVGGVCRTVPPATGLTFNITTSF